MNIGKRGKRDTPRKKPVQAATKAIIKKPIKKHGGNDLPKAMYDGAADFGVFMSLIGLISAIFVGMLMILLAIYLIFNGGTHSSQVEARVLSSKCENKTKTSCMTDIQYIVDQKAYLASIPTTVMKTTDSKIDLAYDPNNPNDIVMKTGWRRRAAYIMFFVAILIILVAYVRYYIVKTYKFAAAGVGAAETASIAKDIIQPTSERAEETETETETEIDSTEESEIAADDSQ